MNHPFNSPVQPWNDPLFVEKGIHVSVKRDDLIHPFISGNKARKLKYILQEAIDAGAQRLVTFGGAWSNHLLATACAAAERGLQSTGFVRGEAVDNFVLTLCRLFGMDLRFCSRQAYRDKPGLFRAHFAAGQAFFVDEGGAGPGAAKGCAELIGELPDAWDHLFCAAGTGTTAAGLANGIRTAGLRTRLHVVPVLKGGDFLETAIRGLLTGEADFILHPGYHFGGYARTPPHLIAFIKYLAATTGLLTDPVYTGKVFYAVHDLARADYFQKGASILVIHTGGLTGIAGKLAEF